MSAAQVMYIISVEFSALRLLLFFRLMQKQRNSAIFFWKLHNFGLSIFIYYFCGEVTALLHQVLLSIAPPTVYQVPKQFRHFLPVITIDK
jgi:hypothetical protein